MRTFGLAGLLGALLLGAVVFAPAAFADDPAGGSPAQPTLDPTWTTGPKPVAKANYPTSWRELTTVPGGAGKRQNCCNDPCGGCWTIEGRRFARKADKWTWITSGAVVAGAAALFASDDTDAIEGVGDWTQLALPVIAGGSTIVKRDWVGAKQFGLSVGTSMLATFAGKQAIGRWRPNEGNNKSFPSGHTMAAFAGASFIYTRYGQKWGIPAYLAAMYVGASRVHANKHFADDVLAGASIAMMSNWLFTKPCGMKCRPRVDFCCRSWRYMFEFGAMYFSENDVEAPPGQGQVIDFTQFQDSERPAIAARAAVQIFRGRGEWYFMLSPNEYRDEGLTLNPIVFDGTVIPAGSSILTRNLIHVYQARWRYELLRRSCFEVKPGVALNLVDSTIQIFDINTGREYGGVNDLQLVPAAHLRLGWRFSRDWLLYWEGELAGNGDTTFLNTSAFVRWQISNYWDLGLGWRFSDGKVENDEYKNTWSANSVVIQIGRSFYPGGH